MMLDKLQISFKKAILSWKERKWKGYLTWFPEAFPPFAKRHWFEGKYQRHEDKIELHLDR